MYDLIEYLEKYKIMTRQQLVERMKQEIQKIQSEKQVERKQEDRRRREQEERIKHSVVDGTRAVMHPVEPGPFEMGEIGHKVDVILTKPFDMMATLTTQIIWKKVADLVSVNLPGKYQINAGPSSFKGDTRPVEKVSYEDIQTWITALNELSQAEGPALAAIIPDHKKGDVYRLPTEAEWEFVVRGRGQYNDNYHFGSQGSQLGDYAWIFKNSGSQTQPVGQKKPLVIDGNEFYDMYGNVWEWVHDWYNANLPGGIDPQGPAESSRKGHVLRGGDFRGDSSEIYSACRSYCSPWGRNHNVGFRLVRTRGAAQ